MKAKLSPGIIAGIVVIALILVGVLFVKGTSEPEQTMKNMPDFSKMSNEDIMKGRAAADAKAAQEMGQHPK